MDVSHREQDDFLSVKGFLLSIRDCLRLQPGGLLWAGHPCNPLLNQKSMFFENFPAFPQRFKVQD